MSDASGAGAARQGGSELPYAQQVAWVLFAIALAGPVCGLLFGKGPGFLDKLWQGAYSVPMALFGLLAMVMPLRNPKDFFGGVLLVGLALFAFWASSDLPGLRGFAF